MVLTRVAVLIGGLLLAACAPEPAPPSPTPPGPELTPVSFDELTGWRDDRISEILPALTRSCSRLAAQSDDRPIGPNGLAGQVTDWREPCAQAVALPAGDDEAARRFFERAFTPYAVSDGATVKGLFTGYYEIELTGARRPDARFAEPLYRTPSDLVTVDLRDFRADLPPDVLVGRVQDGRLRPYLTRGEIDGGALAGQRLELLWIDDPVDAFFLHIQGSGRVRLASGGTVRVGYAANNGHPFFGIARALIDSGALAKEDASMQAVRDWLRQHPAEARELMHRNRRYIFFREIDGEGPVGAQGVSLTPLRSLAVDPAFIPLGAPLWLETSWPLSGSAEAGRPLRRLMIAQDTGGAIKGVVRGDIFWGTGEAALAQAGRMKQTGRYYLFLPRTVAERRHRTN